jgi:hypothetical protein
LRGPGLAVSRRTRTNGGTVTAVTIERFTICRRRDICAVPNGAHAPGRTMVAGLQRRLMRLKLIGAVKDDHA